MTDRNVQMQDEHIGKRLANLFATNRLVSLAVVNIIIIAAVGIAFPDTFFTASNFSVILLSISMEAILAVGMIFLIVAGEFDLSIGAVYALGGAIAATLMKQAEWLPFPFAVLLALITCTVIGLMNGLLVAKVGVNALITTLGMMMVVRAIAVYLAGSAIVDLPEGFVRLGQTVFLGLRMPVYYMLFIVIIGAYLLSSFPFFRQFYFIGGNRKSAVLSGIKVAKSLVINFAIMGFLAGLGGIISAARLNNAVGSTGAGLHLRIIAAVVLGGGSLSGGKGSVGGAVMGVLLLGLLQNTMIIAGVSVYFQTIVTGVILIIAVLLDVMVQKRFEIKQQSIHVKGMSVKK